MLWERSVVEQRYNAVLEVLEAGLPVTEVADRYGVSRQSVHAWVNATGLAGWRGLLTAPIGPTGARTNSPRRWRPGCASCAASIPGGGRSGSGTSWNGVGCDRCRAGWPSTGCWCATS